MKLYVLTTRDIKAGVYNNPLFVHSLGAALRDFADEANRVDPNNILARHPEDFELWHIAMFDNETGEFIPVERKCLAIASNLIVTRN